MIRLLIVDDERAIREFLRDMIPWETLGIAVVGLCKNGVEAYDAILDEYPDIVFTDIRMPGLSGLELISRVKSAQLNIQFVILSGHAEFEFAKEAMRWGVRHYLLKPTNPDQIVEIMKQVAANCYQARSHSAVEERDHALLKRMEQSVVRGLLTEALTSDAPLEEILKRSNQHMDLTNTAYELCYFYYVAPEQQTQVMDAVMAVHASFAQDVPLHSVYVNQALIVFFVSYCADYGALDTALARAADKAEYQRQSYDSFAALLRVLVPKLLRFDNIYLRSGQQGVRINNASRMIHACDEAVSALSRCTCEEQGVLLARIRDQLNATQDVPFLHTLASALLIKYASLCGFSNAQTGLSEIDFESEADPAQLRELIVSKLSEMSALRLKENENAEGDLVRQIKRYVQMNLSNPDLSLKWLAENHLFMNVDYVSKQFAQRTGEKFSAYLTRKRMELARELLKTGDTAHIYDVATRVGCGNNPQYFSQIFKRSTGMTPTEYIRSIK